MVAKNGNKLTLRARDGKLLENCHIENGVIVSDEAVDYEREQLEDLPEGNRPSIGEASEVPYQHLGGPQDKPTGTIDKITVGSTVLYATNKAQKTAELGL